MSEPKVFSSWVYISRAADLPGVWVAQCLDFNIISQGDSPTQALDMAREAFGFSLADDIAHGLDPNKRRGETDPHDWEPLRRLFKQSRMIGVSEMDASARAKTSSVFATFVTVVIVQQPSLQPNIDLDVQEEAVRAA